MRLLHLAARHGPYVLVAGLVAGLGLPDLAGRMQPWLPPMVVLLLFVTILRIEPRAILGSMRDIPKVLGAVLALQLGVPLCVLTVGFVGGWSGSAVLLALLLMSAAPSISGSPNLCLMMGHPPEYAMRLLVVGTALVPVTALPVFWLAPDLSGVGDVFLAAVKLLLTIGVAAGAGMALRMTLLRHPSKSALLTLEGLANITLAVFVIGLMPSLSAVALVDPQRALFWVGIAFIANFGAQFGMRFLTRDRLPPAETTAMSLVAGNRNIALFFVSLPPETLAPILVFIGAYQIPMYLTPLVMRRFYPV